jgi:hypothetical protein
VTAQHWEVNEEGRRGKGRKRKKDLRKTLRSD